MCFRITILYLLLNFSCWGAVFQTEHPQYLKLNEYFVKYQDIEKKGGWPQIKYSRTISLGAIESTIPIIKKRLIISGELNDSLALNDTFDLHLEKAVKLFQQNHNILANGIVDQLTLHEMNIPVTWRLHQIMINMKRWEDYIKINDEPFIFINVAEQKLYLKLHDSTILQMNVIVGRPSRKTPQLSSVVSQIEFNPAWIIPPGIMRKDILPKINRNPSFVTSNNMKVYMDSKKIDPNSIDWNSVDPDSFPYKIVQSPGQKNPMGKLKFYFPNRYYVYMHDTPDTALFNKPIRAFSSGCIRLANAKGLADYLLKEDKGWTSYTVDSLINSGQNITIALKKPIQVIIGYHTAFVNSNGDLQFIPDIYRKDN